MADHMIARLEELARQFDAVNGTTQVNIDKQCEAARQRIDQVQAEWRQIHFEGLKSPPHPQQHKTQNDLIIDLLPIAHEQAEWLKTADEVARLFHDMNATEQSFAKTHYPALPWPG